ncbi:hypothetical protein HanPI659440_Chr04g0149201 [Helianthus annuus]|nr:hypothetical protein HanPI659440_Chr04g0149201 [Helianthus annuus]
MTSCDQEVLTQSSHYHPPPESQDAEVYGAPFVDLFECHYHDTENVDEDDQEESDQAGEQNEENDDEGSDDQEFDEYDVGIEPYQRNR